ncbi:MAG: tetratricopeptide repeat protein [Flavobacteriales bacterium]|nr:tetratricopeptide repeat protein [Flavobacteriales bacterium]
MNLFFRYPIIAFVLLSLLLYGQTIFYGYVLDDYLFITGNQFTLKGFSGIPDIWTHDVFTGVYGESLNRYRPLSATFFAIQYQLLGLQPGLGHLVNILLYAVTAWLIYRLVNRLNIPGSEWISMVSALLFLVHPLHTEVVANIKSLDEILSLLFSLMALLVALKPGFRHKWLAALYLFIAMTAKESAITFVALIPFSLWAFGKEKPSDSMKAAVPMVIAAVGYLTMRISFVGFGDAASQAYDVMFNPFLLASPAEKWASILANTMRYLGLLVWPHPLSFDYSYHQIPYSGWSDLLPWLSIIVWGGLALFGWRQWKKDRIMAYGIVWYIITFSVASNIVVNTGTPLAERFLYTPSVGFSVLTAALLHRLKTSKENATRMAWLVTGLIMCLGLFKTWHRNPAWASNLSLYGTDSKHAPNSALIRMFYGMELNAVAGDNKNDPRMQEAIAELTAATQINPKFHHAWYNLGMVYQKMGLHEQAVTCFRNVLQLQPSHINTHYSIALSLGNGLGRVDEALPYMERLVNEFHSDKPEHMTGLGILYGMKNDYEQAIGTLLRGIQKHPDDAKLNFNLAITYYNKGETEPANFYFSRAFALDPSLKK